MSSLATRPDEGWRRPRFAVAVLFGFPLLIAAISLAVVGIADFVDLPWTLVVESRAYALAFNLFASVVGPAAGGFYLHHRIIGRVVLLIVGGAYGLFVYITSVMLITKFVL